MSLAALRAHIAATITAALPDVTVHPFRPNGIKAFNGYVEFDEIGLTDRELMLGEIGLTVTVNILVATDRATFERVSDDMTPDLIAACEAVGRATVVRPYTEDAGSALLYSLSATFYTESEAA